MSHVEVFAPNGGVYFQFEDIETLEVRPHDSGRFTVLRKQGKNEYDEPLYQMLGNFNRNYSLVVVLTEDDDGQV